MKKILLLGAAAIIASSASSKSVYLNAEPHLDPYKTFEEHRLHSGPDGQVNAVLLVYSDNPDLRFKGLGVSDDADNCLYDAEEKCYVVQIFNDTHTIYAVDASGEYEPIHIDGGFKSRKIYTAELSTIPANYMQQLTDLTVNTDSGSDIFIDGLQLKSDSPAAATISVTPGRHTVYAQKPMLAYTEPYINNQNYHGKTYTYSSEKREINVGRSSAKVDIPVSGNILFNVHSKHREKYDNIHVTFEVDEKAERIRRKAAEAAGTTFVPSVLPSKSSFTISSNEDMGSLRGNYIAYYSAKGYHSKKSRYTVEPGDKVDGEIKLDKIALETMVAYQASNYNLIGMKIGICGKYWGWYVSGGFLGLNDPLLRSDKNDYYDYTSYNGDDSQASWRVATGPMFRILRTSTSILLSVGAGYGQTYFDKNYPSDHNSSWLANVDVDFRFKKGFTLGVGYDYFLKRYNGPSDDKPLNYLKLNIGYTF